jgi:serine protease Do
LAAELKLPTAGGLLIQEVGRGSAAEQAGLKGYRDVVLVGNERLGIGGDFITEIDGKSVTESDALSRAIARKRPGDTITVKVYRAGKMLDVAVKLGEVPEERF